ncbi:IS66 family transposase, partial [Mycobacterium sp.]|uniref:IS66 family transposase n=1 Tax=Mycobacterium sp. TaxID=1785 RepID=UPI003BAEF5E1
MDDDLDAPLRRPTYNELLEENARLKKRVVELERQVERLTGQVAELLRLIEKLRGEGKRQAAPFRKQDQPGAEPKKPGRKSGRRHGPHAHRSVPPRIDEVYQAPLPAKCPHCHARRLKKTGVVRQFQTEIPRRVIYRRFDVERGLCQNCGQAVVGRHALMTSTATGAAASQFGPNVHALLTVMNKECGLSHGKCVKLLATTFEGMKISRGASARSTARTARRCEPAYAEVRRDVRSSRQVVPDETGWRVGGRNAWLHDFVSQHATCYVIDPTRSGQPAERLLGRDWAGTLVHDGWSVYDRFTAAAHQQCLAHLVRRCRGLLETARGAAAGLPQGVLALVEEAYALRRLWRGHRLDRDRLAEAGLVLSRELDDLASGRFHSLANRRLAAHLRAHALAWFWFLIDPTIDSTNYRAEQALRPAVVNRKVWGGNRTWAGAQAQAILMSVLRTCAQRLAPGFDFLVNA